MYSKIIFYNEFNNGDLFESREFVRMWMKLIPSDEYFYAHKRSHRILMDIHNLQFTGLLPSMSPTRQMRYDKDTLYINTWVGITGRYLLPGIGCTVEGLYKMYSEILGKPFPGKPSDYLTDFDYLYYDLDPCHEFLGKHQEEKIFIDNGMVLSKQAENFPFHEAISIVAANNKDKCFIVSEPLPVDMPNVYSTDSITKRLYICDLPEISYLSRFCTTLIGRNSGPHVFTQVKANLMDETKKLVSFTYEQTGASFVANNPDVKIRRYWFNLTEPKLVAQAIQRTIND